MPEHDLRLKLNQPVPIGRTDIVVAVDSDGSLLGRVKISKGGIDWLPAKNSVNSYSLTWEAFDDLMQQRGRRKKAT
jgi:hypothetical protein